MLEGQEGMDPEAAEVPDALLAPIATGERKLPSEGQRGEAKEARRPMSSVPLPSDAEETEDHGQGN
jgi:hypothetical protein